MTFKTGEEIFGAKVNLDKLEHELGPSHSNLIDSLNDQIKIKNELIHELQIQLGAKDLEIEALRETVVSLSVHLAVTAREHKHPFRRMVQEED